MGVVSTKIVSSTSSEADNGLGDGDTVNDIQITGDLSVSLRAERSGKGCGRTYTITVDAADAAGNTTQKTTAVSVPKKHEEAPKHREASKHDAPKHWEALKHDAPQHEAENWFFRFLSGWGRPSPRG